MEILQHGEAHLWHEPVPRRLRRPHENWATRSRALSSFHRAGARPDGFGVRSRHVRDHALLGGWPSGLGCGGRDFAAVWQAQPKWVVSRSLQSVGPNARLIGDDFETVIRGLKIQLEGEIAVAGPNLAESLTNLGLIDEYRLYLRPIVLGSGQPFFVGPRAAAPPGGERSGCRGRDSVDVRSCLIARRTALQKFKLRHYRRCGSEGF